MSLINDALKRAQEERLAPPGEMPGVPVYQKAPDHGLRREIGVIALLVILVVLLFGGLVGLLVYLRLRPAPVPPPATPVVTTTDSTTPRPPQSRYGKAMAKAKTVAGQVATIEQEGRETANDLGASATPSPAPVPVPPPTAPAPAATTASVPAVGTAPVLPPSPPPPATAAPVVPATPPAMPPAPAYKLSGIIGRAPTFTALINGQMVKLHDHVGTAEVITLETTRAVLRETDGKTVELTITGNH